MARFNRKSIVINIFVLISALSVFMAPSLILAQSPAGGFDTNVSPAGEPRLNNPLGNTGTLDALVVKVTNAAFKIGVPIAAIFIIWAGLKFVMARGKPDEIKEAKQIFWYTIIGTAILLASKLLAGLLQTTITQLSS